VVRRSQILKASYVQKVKNSLNWFFQVL
jgi:hypothetical protein